MSASEQTSSGSTDNELHMKTELSVFIFQSHYVFFERVLLKRIANKVK